jgi:hypothetical protein
VHDKSAGHMVGHFNEWGLVCFACAVPVTYDRHSPY